MKADLMDILCCPMCRSDLRLVAIREEAGEIVAGTLTCTKCATVYPIEDGIPNLLPPDERD
ncbi:MAG: methytransferase partner Trm112 [Thermoplasmata archaeon]